MPSRRAEPAVAKRRLHLGRLGQLLRPERSTTAPATAPARTNAARKRNPSRGPSSRGRTSAATKPPIGTAVWRTPSASPRSCAPKPPHHRAPAARTGRCRRPLPRAEEERRASRSRARTPPRRGSPSRRRDRRRAWSVRRSGRLRSPTAASRRSARSTPPRARRRSRSGSGHTRSRRSGAITATANVIDREARLRARAGGEHRPPVTRLGYRPKGLIGREPVFTVTLFVSR